MIKDRLLTGAASNIYVQAIVAASQIALIPVFANSLGAERYGIWLMLFTIPSYVAFCDLGLATVAGNSMTMLVAQGDELKASDLYLAARRMITIIAALLTGFGTSLVLLSEHLHLGTRIENWSGTAILLLIFSCLALINSLYQSAFKAIGRYGTGNVIYGTALGIENATAALICAYTRDIYYVAIAYTTVRLASTVSQHFILEAFAPWLTVKTGKTSITTSVRQLIKPAIALMFIPIAQAIYLHAPTLIIGSIISPTAAAVFSTSRTLARLCSQAVSILNHAVLPEFIRAIAVAPKKANKYLWFTLKSSVAIATPFAAGICILGEWAISKWTNGNIQPDHKLIMLLGATVLVNACWQPLSNLLLALNLHNRFSYAYLLIAATLAYIYYKNAGICGTATAGIFMLSTDIAMALYTIPITIRSLISYESLKGKLR